VKSIIYDLISEIAEKVRVGVSEEVVESTNATKLKRMGIGRKN
jgi:hypothetical protein